MEAILNKLQELCGIVSQKNSELAELAKESIAKSLELDGLIAEVKAGKKVLKAERAEIKRVKDVVVLKAQSDEALAKAQETLLNAEKVALEEEKNIKNTRFLMVSERSTLDSRKEGLDGKEVDLKKREEKLKENTQKVKEAAKKLGLKL